MRFNLLFIWATIQRDHALTYGTVLADRSRAQTVCCPISTDPWDFIEGLSASLRFIFPSLPGHIAPLSGYRRRTAIHRGLYRTCGRHASYI